MHAFEFYGEVFARWLKAQNESRPVRFEKVEPGDEQILEDRAQHELDAVSSFLAIRAEEDAAAEPDE